MCYFGEAALQTEVQFMIVRTVCYKLQSDQNGRFHPQLTFQSNDYSSERNYEIIIITSAHSPTQDIIISFSAQIS